MIPDIPQYLKDHGWRADGPPHSRYWWKRFTDPGIPRCKCNDEKPGIQVVITHHAMPKIEHESYTIDVTGQKPDGVWVKLEAYGISPDELLKVLDDQVNDLVIAWTLLALD